MKYSGKMSVVQDELSAVNMMHSNQTENVVISQEALIVCAVVDILGFFTGTICNFLVVITISMTKKLCNSSINRAVLNLCLADLFVILVDIPLTTTILIGNHIHYAVSKCLSIGY